MPQNEFKLQTCIIPQGQFGTKVTDLIQNRNICQQVNIIEASQQPTPTSVLPPEPPHLCFATCDAQLSSFLKVQKVTKELKAYQTVFVTTVPPFFCLHLQRFLEPNQWVVAVTEPEDAKPTNSMVASNIIQDIHDLFSEKPQIVGVDLSDLRSTAKASIHWGFSFEGSPIEVMKFLHESEDMIGDAPGIIYILAFDPSHIVTLDKIVEFADVVDKYAEEDADIVWGATHTQTIPGGMRVTLILRHKLEPDFGFKKIWYGERPQKADEISRARDFINPIMINRSDVEETISIIVEVETVDPDIDHPEGFQVDIYGKSDVEDYVNCVSIFKSDEKALAQKLVTTVRPGTVWLVTGEPMVLMHMGITVIQAHYYQAVKPFDED